MIVTFKPSPNLIAQLAHFAWGALIVLLFAIFGREELGIVLMLSFATVKEFAWDRFIEKQPTINNLDDFIVYMAGVGAAIILFAIAKGVL